MEEPLRLIIQEMFDIIKAHNDILKELAIENQRQYERVNDLRRRVLNLELKDPNPPAVQLKVVC